jgi:hypothetical protein
MPEPASIDLFDRNSDDTGSHHSERTRCTYRHVDDPATNKRSTIVDAALYGMTGVSHRDDASERSGSMRAGHLVAMASPAIVRGETGFGFT